MFLVFSTQELAQSACDRIFNNIRSWLKEYYPVRVHPKGLVALNFDGTPNMKGAVTTKWADPKEYQEGWAIPKPEQMNVGLVPIAIVLEGVDGDEVAEVKPIILENLEAP